MSPMMNNQGAFPHLKLKGTLSKSARKFSTREVQELKKWQPDADLLKFCLKKSSMKDRHNCLDFYNIFCANMRKATLF
jgi:hypothetical protein